MSQQSGSYSDEEHEDETSQEEEYSEEENYQADESSTENSHALNLKWCLGFNYELFDGAHNLTNDNRKEIFYVAGHTGVIYDYENRTQRLLQGHCNKITSCSYCPDRGIIITADKGPSALLVVWEVTTGIPKKTIFDPHPNGVECLDVSSDGQLIATLSREVGQVYSQTVSIWKWDDDDKNPCFASGVLNSTNHTSNPDNPIDYQYFIRFNHLKKNEFATTGKKSVRFWNTNENGSSCSSYSPMHPSKEANNHREYTQTVFIPKTTQAVTGTMDGHLVVWDISLIMEDYSQPDQRREIKSINLLGITQKNDAKKNAITILKAHKEFIIIGSSNGSVRFYDYQFRIVSWFEDFG
jgi:WD40 repeat protein